MRRILLRCTGRSFSTSTRSLDGVMHLREFMADRNKVNSADWQQETASRQRDGLKFFIETYGCQMNVADSEVIRSVLLTAGHTLCDSVEEADLIMTNTCAIRENAEDKIWKRLEYFQSLRKKNRQLRVRKGGYPVVGVLGCMAERLKTSLLEEKSVDFVCGPDAYRDIPRLVSVAACTDFKDANTVLSIEETYADINPVRETNSVSAFVSIMRGCNNMCSYCIVPFTRGRERSRPIASIEKEVQTLVDEGVKEVMLLGQNVNGYHDTSDESVLRFPDTKQAYATSTGFEGALYKSRTKDAPGPRFVHLLNHLATTHPNLRIRFTSPHPKDFPPEVLSLIARTPNLCNSLHLPVQSGSDSNLHRMRRGYTREVYMDLVTSAREQIPNVTISSDFISGFCGETEDEHKDTLTLMEEVQYDMAFMFAYSMRDKTHASHRLDDDVPEDVKLKRLQEVIATYHRVGYARLHAMEPVGALRLVLLEQLVKNKYKIQEDNDHDITAGSVAVEETKDNTDKVFMGRTDNNRKCILLGSIDDGEMFGTHEGSRSHDPTQPLALNSDIPHRVPVLGDYMVVQIAGIRGKTIITRPLAFSSIPNYAKCFPELSVNATSSDKTAVCSD